MMAPGAMAKNLVKVLDFGQPIEWFLVRGLKIFMDNDIRATIVDASAAT